MTTQPEALRLAKDLKRIGAESSLTRHHAAYELRRLHEANQELLEALKELKAVTPIFPKDGDCLVGYRERYNAAQYKASAAIAKHKGAA